MSTSKEIREKQLKQIEEMITSINDGLTREEFLEAFEQVVKVVNQIKETNQTHRNELQDEIKKAQTDLKEAGDNRLDNAIQKLQQKADKIFEQERKTLNFIKDKAQELRDGRDGKDADEPKIVSEVLSKIELPDELTKEELRDKIENLKGNERLNIESIDGWEEKLEELKKLIRKSSGRIMSPKYVHTPMVDNFSGSTNGTLKTFTLSKEPKDVSTMKIWGSDFPHILIANTDFTVAGRTLTLTSEVDAPYGTLIAEYYI